MKVGVTPWKRTFASMLEGGGEGGEGGERILTKLTNF